jgi:hypothetical protein
MADEFEIDPADVIVIPFIFVPPGDPWPTDWLRDHPGAFRVPAVFVPRAAESDTQPPDWELRMVFDADPAPSGTNRVVKASVQPEVPGWLDPLARLFGIPGAAAQTPSRGGGRGAVPGTPARSPAEELRMTRFENALVRLRKLEPDNRALSFVRDPANVPGESWVIELENEVIAAMARRAPRTTAPERSGLSVRDLVMRGDKPIGWQEGGRGQRSYHSDT